MIFCLDIAREMSIFRCVNSKQLGRKAAFWSPVFLNDLQNTNTEDELVWGISVCYKWVMGSYVTSL